MKKLLFAAAAAALSTAALSAQAVIWSVNPPAFNSAINGATLGGPGQVVLAAPTGWGMAFANWAPTTGAMSAPLLSDYTFTSNLTTTATQASFNINLIFRDSAPAPGNPALGEYQLFQSINTSTTQIVVPLSSFGVLNSNPLTLAEMASVGQIEFFVGGLQAAGTLTMGNQQLQIPEPSTYAAIAGALALGLVAYRRRR